MSLREANVDTHINRALKFGHIDGQEAEKLKQQARSARVMHAEADIIERGVWDALASAERDSMGGKRALAQRRA